MKLLATIVTFAALLDRVVSTSFINPPQLPGRAKGIVPYSNIRAGDPIKIEWTTDADSIDLLLVLSVNNTANANIDDGPFELFLSESARGIPIAQHFYIWNVSFNSTTSSLISADGNDDWERLNQNSDWYFNFELRESPTRDLSIAPLARSVYLSANNSTPDQQASLSSTVGSPTQTASASSSALPAQTTTAGNEGHSGHLSTGAKAGIAIGTILGVALLAVLIFLAFKTCCVRGSGGAAGTSDTSLASSDIGGREGMIQAGALRGSPSGQMQAVGGVKQSPMNQASEIGHSAGNTRRLSSAEVGGIAGGGVLASGAMMATNRRRESGFSIPRKPVRSDTGSSVDTALVQPSPTSPFSGHNQAYYPQQGYQHTYQQPTQQSYQYTRPSERHMDSAELEPPVSPIDPTFDTEWEGPTKRK